MNLKGFIIILLHGEAAGHAEASLQDLRHLRLEQGSQRVFTGESPAGEEKEGPSEEHPQGLLAAVITLGVITVVLLLIIIYGYCKFVRKKREEMDERGNRDDKREESEDLRAPPSSFPPQENVPQISHLSVPVKMRKRSMTFTQTDEECRKYREDLADSYEKPPEAETEAGHRSRKKSVVTFADEQKINSDEM